MDYKSVTTQLSFVSPAIQLNHQASCRFEVKKPADCLLAELFNFYSLLKKGNKVSLKNLHEKIYQCELLGFCYSADRLVGISAIKRPDVSYIELVHQKAGILRNMEEFCLEVGYSFTETAVRRYGISSKLKDLLQLKINHYKGIIFATTAIPSSQHYLIARGFSALGNPYQGVYDNDIIYFEKRMN